MGMDLQSDANLLWIARMGLKTPLPEPWKPCKTESGDVYYFNFQTGDSIWEHPCDQYYIDLFQHCKQKKTKENDNKSNSSSSKSNGSTTTGGNGLMPFEIAEIGMFMKMKQQIAALTKENEKLKLEVMDKTAQLKLANEQYRTLIIKTLMSCIMYVVKLICDCCVIV